MRRWKLMLSLITSGFLGLSFLLNSGSDPLALDSSRGITESELRSIVEFLASDDMEGREAGTQTNRIAARYLAHELELLGLEPAGSDGTYFQTFDLVRGALGENNRLSLSQGGTATAAELHSDFFPERLSASAELTAPAVFAGYGISAPLLDHDDYARIDARDKVVFILEGEPENDDPESVFDGLVESAFSDTSYKLLNAQSHGAVAVVLISSSNRENLSFSSRRTWPTGVHDRFELATVVEEIRIPALRVSRQYVAPFLSGGRDLFDLEHAAGREEADALTGMTVSLSTEIDRERVPSENVLARLPGMDASVSNEIIVLGAHFDHVGKRNQEIYNGADDDASGTAALLEIAEAFVESQTSPRRSILFAFWNAEEQGLLGSRYYVAHPKFPLEDTKAVFQLDMVGRNQEVDDPDSWRFGGLPRQSAEENINTLHIIGHSRSQDLKVLVERANSDTALDLLFELDNQKLNLIRRTDSWPFLVEGIPALFLTTGLHPDYHTPADDAEKLNYAKMRRVAQLAFLAGWQVSNDVRVPQLNAN